MMVYLCDQKYNIWLIDVGVASLLPLTLARDDTIVC